MGIYRRGINGPFSGKAGSVVGSRWKKIDYIRGLSRPSHKEASEAQLLQQHKFELMTAFLSPLSKVFEFSYKEDTRYKTAYNIALGYNLKWAFVEKEDEWIIDFSRIVLSRGSLPKPVDATAEYTAEGAFLIRWQTLVRNSFVSAEDKVRLILYNSVANIHIINTSDYERKDGEAMIKIEDDDAARGIWHIFMFYSSPSGDNSSSHYLGEITIE
ncbi:hypothetical protein BDE36_3749 [Arcticibacter tournemirensis]|uniref:Uncharacterized protein n=1 Tax=Arcticibacter tournemirensis TaxID=699437 RepID=A0A5M9H8Z9_9SPHI|nr:DUF6266 family protein [Arcticibacter tournemirensis]KAA8483130.1 hypothetical protein F1649_09980 [Arcticibacter tournemirensis]TQM51955.1 hypothetical protein BDE36_3749 [Arcticibacter tournemirensis]